MTDEQTIAELRARVEEVERERDEARAELARVRESLEAVKHDRSNLLIALHQIEFGDYEMGGAVDIASNAINVHKRARRDKQEGGSDG